MKRANEAKAKFKEVVDFWSRVQDPRARKAAGDYATTLLGFYQRAKAESSKQKPTEKKRTDITLDRLFTKKAPATDARVRELEKQVKELAKIVEKLRDSDAKRKERRLN